MSPPQNLRQALNRLDTLPAVPRIAREILSLKIITHEGEQALLDLVEKDPPTLSKIIGLANSPLFGTGRKILTLHDAATLLGSKRVKMVALSFAMMSSLTRKPAGLLNIHNLWQHSLIIAMTMDSLSRFMPEQRRPAEDAIYLAGLLHDIGFLVLECIDTQLSDKFHARLTAEPERPVIEIEAEVLEMNHGELGATLGRHWSLPEDIIAVINYHHTPDDQRAAIGQPLVTLANLAEKLSPTFCITQAAPPKIGVDEWLALGIDPSMESKIMPAVAKNTREVAAMYS